MTPRIEAIAYHGWGYDQTAWTGWQTVFADQNIAFVAFDRGYFGDGFTPQFSEQVFKLLLVHSYGLHLCPQEQLHMADLLVIFSSFLTFHPEAERLKRRSQRVLQRMVDEFAVNPTEVLTTFKINSDDPASECPTTLDHDLLLRDLKHLGITQIDPSILQSIPKILVVHGDRDRIVPVEQGRTLASQLAPNADYAEIAGAGHALPFTHQSACWTTVNAHLPFRYDRE